MDKYQKILIGNRLDFWSLYDTLLDCNIYGEQGEKPISFDSKTETYVINTKYIGCKTVSIIANKFNYVSNLRVLINNKWIEYPVEQHTIFVDNRKHNFIGYLIEFDIDNKIEKIEYAFIENIADKYIVDVKYI